MKRFMIIVAVIVLVVALFALHLGVQAHAQTTHVTTSVCTDTGLTGAALTENGEFCSTNTLTGVVTNCCSSVYQQAIHAAQQLHLVVGTPVYLTQSVSWGNPPVAVTRVWFSTGLEAWHFDPSNGIAMIEDAYGRVLYSGQ
jgi:hypothetical protein